MFSQNIIFYLDVIVYADFIGNTTMV